ncbi:MAG TPA: PilZ domain-containing protein [Gemmataceae bacterium]|nr:PilZ domain-containing protein [Gemmataceae bacterium]
MSRPGLPGCVKPATRKQVERRRSVRFSPAQEIICYWSRDGGGYAPARVCDISAGGVCLLAPGRFESGAVLSLQLINGAHTFLCARTLQVKRVYQGNGVDSVIAGAFDRKLDYDELLPFLV